MNVDEIGRVALFGAFRITAHDAELIALGIGKHHPARSVSVPTIGDLSGTQPNDAIDLVVSAPIARSQVKVDPSTRCAQLVDLDEQESMTDGRVQNHAVVVAASLGSPGTSV